MAGSAPNEASQNPDSGLYICGRDRRETQTEIVVRGIGGHEVYASGFYENALLHGQGGQVRRVQAFRATDPKTGAAKGRRT